MASEGAFAAGFSADGLYTAAGTGGGMGGRWGHAPDGRRVSDMASAVDRRPRRMGGPGGLGRSADVGLGRVGRNMWPGDMRRRMRLGGVRGCMGLG